MTRAEEPTQGTWREPAGVAAGVAGRGVVVVVALIAAHTLVPQARPFPATMRAEGGYREVDYTDQAGQWAKRVVPADAACDCHAAAQTLIGGARDMTRYYWRRYDRFVIGRPLGVLSYDGVSQEYDRANQMIAGDYEVRARRSYRIHWGGLAADVTVWGGVWLLVACGLARGFRWARGAFVYAPASRCARCGYPVEDSMRCPECGQAM